MAYSKMTVADFRKKLAGGHYQNHTGARRGVGKADLDEAEKAKCYRAINKHFGVEDETKAAKKGGKKKASKKATAKKVPAKKAAAKAAAEPKAAKVTPPKVSKKRAAKSGKTRAAQVTDVDVDAMAQLHLAGERIGTISQAIAAMKAAKEAYPELDTQEGATAAGAALTDIVQSVHKTVRGEQLELLEVNPTVMSTLARTAPAAQGLPGQESPVRVPGNSAAETPMAEASQPSS